MRKIDLIPFLFLGLVACNDNATKEGTNADTHCNGYSRYNCRRSSPLMVDTTAAIDAGACYS